MVNLRPEPGPRVNEPELQRVLDFVSTHEEQHDQENWIALAQNAGDAPELYEVVPQARDGDEYVLRDVPVLRDEQVWSCGTAACVAGWTALLNGWRPIGDDPEAVFKDGVVRDVRGLARELLWLDDYQADRLFDPDQSLDEVWYEAHELTDGRVVRPSSKESS